MPRKRMTWTAIAAATGALLLPAAWDAAALSQNPDSQIEESSAGEGALSGDARLREGATLVDQPGVFQLVGDRVVFVSDGGRQFTALENLALERVARAVRQATSTRTWLASGVVTEYQGGNYLLLERAVIYRSTSEPPRAR